MLASVQSIGRCVPDLCASQDDVAHLYYSPNRASRVAAILTRAAIEQSFPLIVGGFDIAIAAGMVLARMIAAHWTTTGRGGAARCAAPRRHLSEFLPLFC
jgi:ribose/xylose/arabinose/galactoside ABC-type transport system permease subunit